VDELQSRTSGYEPEGSVKTQCWESSIGELTHSHALSPRTALDVTIIFYVESIITYVPLNKQLEV
jgi:hypothetical protein